MSDITPEEKDKLDAVVATMTKEITTALDKIPFVGSVNAYIVHKEQMKELVHSVLQAGKKATISRFEVFAVQETDDEHS